MSGDLASTADILKGVPLGERDDTLFRWACRLRRQVGDDGRRIVELAVLNAAANCDPPFLPDEALRKVEQAWQQDHTDSFVDWASSLDELSEADAPQLNLKRGSEIRTRERPEMLVENVLPPGGLFQVFGQTGEYKSCLVLSMIGAVANGIPWLGHKVNQPGRAALI